MPVDPTELITHSQSARDRLRQRNPEHPTANLIDFLLSQARETRQLEVSLLQGAINEAENELAS